MNKMPDNFVSFMLWMHTHTSYIQSNVIQYKGKMYFTDRRKISDKLDEYTDDGGLDDLWKIYILNTIG